MPPETCNVSSDKVIEACVEVSSTKVKLAETPPTELSTYDLIAFADAKVSSEADTEIKLVSTTPEAKSATSTFDRELPVPLASKVLLVKASEDDAVI